MTEIDDKLLHRFFNEQKQEITDRGFSKRVMGHLPDRAQKLSNAWVSFCSALAVVLFFALDGLFVLSDLLQQVFVSTVQFFATTPIDLKAWGITAVVLLVVGLGRLFSME